MNVIFLWHEQNIICSTGRHRCLSHVNVTKDLCVLSGLNAVFSDPLFQFLIDNVDRESYCALAMKLVMVHTVFIT
jgi:hypothetical protein